MSTSNVPVYVRYIGNENATEFSVTFPYIDKKYVKVYLARERISPELLDETRYNFVNDTTIQFPIKDDDALLGYNDALIILRKTDLGSDYDFDNQRRLFPEDVMNADDLAFQQIQELAYEVSRAIKVDITGEKTPDDLIDSLYEGERRAEQYAAQAEESKLSAEQFANDAETGANIANSSAARAQESALEAMSAKEYAEQAANNASISEENASQSAEIARQYAEQAEESSTARELVYENIGRLNQIGYYGTLVGDTLTFEKPYGEEEYELKKGFTYLVDLQFEAVGELDDSVKIVIKNNDNNVNIVNVIHSNPDEPVTVGELKQIMRYNTVGGWRWIFNAWYTETQGGSRVLVMPSTVVAGGDVDTQMSDSSENAVQNKVIKSYIDTTGSNLQSQINTQATTLDKVKNDVVSNTNEITSLKEVVNNIGSGGGSGGGSSITVDAEMSDTSENPVQNKVVKNYIDTAEQDIISGYMNADSDLQLQINGQATVLTEVKDDVMSNMAEIADIKGQLSNVGSITITYLE